MSLTARLSGKLCYWLCVQGLSLLGATSSDMPHALCPPLPLGSPSWTNLNPTGGFLVGFTDNLGPKGLSDIPQFQKTSRARSKA